MHSLFTKQIIGVIVVIVLVGVVWFVFGMLQNDDMQESVVIDSKSDVDPQRKVIGVSVEGREIEAYTYGNGEIQLAFVGGIHGGIALGPAVLHVAVFVQFVDGQDGHFPGDVVAAAAILEEPDDHAVGDVAERIARRFSQIVLDCKVRRQGMDLGLVKRTYRYNTD